MARATKESYLGLCLDFQQSLGIHQSLSTNKQAAASEAERAAEK